MAQQERALAAKPKDFSSVPGTSLGGKREPIPSCPDPYVCTVASLLHRMSGCGSRTVLLAQRQQLSS